MIQINIESYYFLYKIQIMSPYTAKKKNRLNILDDSYSHSYIQETKIYTYFFKPISHCYEY